MTMSKDFVILDLDGTICNDGHRDHLAVAKQWDDYHSLCTEDLPHPEVKYVVDLLSNDSMEIVALTGRPEKYRGLTVAWLSKHDIPVDTLLMRPDNDFSRANEMKIKMLEQHFGDKEAVLRNVLFALEDTDRVTESFRNYGIPTWQVRQR